MKNTSQPFNHWSIQAIIAICCLFFFPCYPSTVFAQNEDDFEIDNYHDFNLDNIETAKKERHTFDSPKDFYVTAESNLNIRDHYVNGKVIGKLVHNQIVSVYGTIGHYSIIHYQGQEAYVATQYLKPSSKSTHDSSSDDTSFLTKNYLNYIPVIIAVLGVLGLILIIFDITPLWYFIVYAIATPIMASYYCNHVHTCMWFIYPDEVGWLMTIVDFMLLIGYLSFLWGMIKESFFAVISVFRGNFLAFFLGIIGLFLYINTAIDIIDAAFNEILIAGIIALIFAASNDTSFIGTFTDRDGNKWNVYEK